MSGRFRKTYKNIEALAESIATNGLLQPIVVQTGTNKLICGGRRLKALEYLGYTEIPDDYVRFLDINSLISGEHDENVLRDGFTNTELLAISAAIAEEIKSRNKKAIAEGHKKRGQNKTESHEETPSNDPQEQTETIQDKAGKPASRDNRSEIARRTDTIVAETIGIGKDKYRQMKEIVEAADANPEVYGHFKTEIDAEGASISAIYERFKTKKNSLEKPNYGPSEAFDRLVNSTKQQLYPKIYSAMCFLPHKLQDDLVAKHGKFILMTSQACADKALKAKAGDIVNIKADEDMYEALDNAFTATRETVTKWVFQDQVGNVANSLMQVVYATGDEVSTFDRVEFFAITLSMAANLFSKYLTVLSREGGLDQGLNQATIDALASLTPAIDAMIKDGIFNRLALAQKEILGGGPEVFADSTRAKANAIKVSENMVNIDDTISFFASDLLERQKKLLAKIAQPIAAAEAKIAENNAA